MSARGHIPFVGRAHDKLGIAMWQADGSGPEPAAVGHSFDTPLERITAHYYVASRDYGGIDPQARGGLKAAAPFRGFTRFAAALAAAKRRPDDVVLKLPLISPREDREGHEWTYRDGVETRRLYLHGHARLELGGAPLLALPVPVLVLTEDYRGARDFNDVRLSLASEPCVPQIAAAGVRSTDRLVAQALLADLDGGGLRLVADAVKLLEQTFGGNGRLGGRFGEIREARMEIVE